jgi:hypothetical protein
LDRIPPGGDGNVFIAVDFVHNGRCIGAESRLEFPQYPTGLGVEGYEVAVGLAAKEQAARRNR